MITSSTRAEGCAALAEIEDAVHRVEQRIELVRGEEHGDALGLLNPLHQRDGRLLEVRIEAQQRFVEQKQLRLAEQRLREEQPLELASGELAQRPRRERLRLDGCDGAVHVASARSPGQRKPPALAVKRARDEIPAGEPQIGDRRALLRKVAGGGIAARGRGAQHLDFARGRTQQPENRLKQRRLAGAVGAEHADEFAGTYGHADIREDDASRARKRHPVELDREHRLALAESAIERVELRRSSTAGRSSPAARFR